LVLTGGENFFAKKFSPHPFQKIFDQFVGGGFYSDEFCFLCVILSERTNASRRISPAQSKRGCGVYAQNSSANVTLRA